MDICRFCLSTEGTKDVCQLQVPKSLKKESFLEVLSYCMDHQIDEDSKISRMLCIKCYKKVLSFYKFKCLAVKNYDYLISLHQQADIKNEVYLKDDVMPVQPLVGDVCLNSKIKEELDENNEEHGEEYLSDEEFLSVIKKIKYEYVMAETKENVSAPVKNRRGHHKVPKDKLEEKKLEICEECGQAVRNLKSHMKKHLALMDRKRYKCKVCDRDFGSYGARYRHNKVKHLGIKQHCNICNKDVIDLKSHQLKVHNAAALPCECASCARRFISPSALREHLSTHTRDRPHGCPVCGKAFRIKLLLDHHKRSVHDHERSHLCQFCSKSFFKKYHLQNHLRTHTKEKPHPCPECGKCFASTSVLKNHRTVHSDVKPHQCSVCDAAFSRVGYLRAHMLSHTKEKRFPCQYCGVGFHRSDHRKRHEFTAHQKHLVTTA